jgi:hypothetical protein
MLKTYFLEKSYLTIFASEFFKKSSKTTITTYI